MTPGCHLASVFFINLEPRIDPTTQSDLSFPVLILGDPGADSGDKEKSKRAEKCMV